MTSFLTQKKFDFVSQAMESNTFGVVSFKGTEGFSLPYEFEILLVAWDPEVDLTAVLERAATFTILRPEGDIPFHGILSQFEQLQEVNDVVFYRAVLVPRLWWLSLTHHNQIFLDKTIPDIIAEVLLDGGLTAADFELRLTGSYPSWEYICQYNESHLAFVSRWMEREGMYYFFEQHPEGERMVITDSSMAHVEMAEGVTMSYSPPSGLADPFREEVVHALVCKQRLLPKKLHLSDYNYRLPSLNLSSEAQVTDRGRGEVHIYGEHFRTTEEGTALAKIRAQELLCQEKRFFGESTIPFLRPGYRFDLQRHYREGFNQKYLTTQLEHEGNQSGYLLAGLREGLAERESRLYYSNSFVAISSGVQYRPPRISEKPRFYGTINARIDAAGSGEYAELDGQGRYKVRLPFDRSGRQGGMASHYLRMAQPYAGTDHGMHFPLHKGTEVLLTFVEGDPDRPIIAGAVPNPERPSVLGSATQTMAAITTAGQNKIHFEDQEGKRRILMQSPTSNSWVRMGAPNDPPNPYPAKAGDTISTRSDSTGTWTLWENSAAATKVVSEADHGTLVTFRLVADPQGNTPETPSFRTVKLSVSENLDVDPSNGIRIRTDDSLCMESEKGYGEFRYRGLPNDLTGNLLTAAQFLNTNAQVSGLKSSYDDSAQTLTDAMNAGSIVLSATDTFIIEQGNVYELFVDNYPAKYGFGGSYEETHMGVCTADGAQTPLYPDLPQEGNEITNVYSAQINKLEEWDLLDKGGHQYEGWREAAGNPPLTKELDGEWSAGLVFIEKKFGNSYEYSNGDTISISLGDTQEVKVGGKHIETSYNGDGTRTSYSVSEKGITTEKTFDYHSGTMTSYTFKVRGHFTYELTVPNYPKLGISMDFSALNAAISLSTGVNLKASASASASLSISASASIDVDIKFVAAGKIEVENLAGKTNIPGLVGKWGLTHVDAEMTELKSKVNNIQTVVSNLNSSAFVGRQSLTETMNNILTLIS